MWISKKLVYYTSAESSPLERKLYTVNWDGSNKKCLTPEKGVHAITPCAGYSFFVDKNSTLSSVPVYTLRNADGKVIRTLEDNKDLAAKMKRYAWGNIQLTRLQGATEELNAWMITPPGFDKNKKSPVYVPVQRAKFAGGGRQVPGGQLLVAPDAGRKGLHHCMRGWHRHRVQDKEFRKKTYLQLGESESDDQIAVAKNLGKLPYVDKNRIGIWGWSYGGLVSHLPHEG